MKKQLTEEQVRRFRELAQLDYSRDLIKELLELDEEKKKEKKDCVKGNKNHGSDGRFSKKGSSSSWSGHSGGKDTSQCKAGQWRVSGNRKLITKGKDRCGRKDRLDPNIKGKYKCKDGTLSESETYDIDMLSQSIADAMETFSSEFIGHEEFLTFIANMRDFMNVMEAAWTVSSVKNNATDTEQREKSFPERTELEQPLDEKRGKLRKGMKGEGLTREKVERECARFGMMSFETFLQTLNRYEAAKKASLNQGQK